MTLGQSVTWKDIVSVCEIKQRFQNRAPADLSCKGRPNSSYIEAVGQLVDRCIQVLIQQPGREFVVGAVLAIDGIEILKVRAGGPCQRTGLITISNPSDDDDGGVFVLRQLLSQNSQALGFLE
eukprot:c12747_g1_i1.p1 GENE.c12747_g1_i1~~c12747_g1_i1.p1  ORF type:complete len:123 (-),score=30.83 c12747_g1_i1:248-616(-)